MDKKKLILIPGMSYNAQLYQQQIDKLSGNYDCKVIVIAQNNLEDAVTQVLDDVDGCFSIIGHSIGAWLSLAIAAAAPDRVEKLITVGGFCHYFQGIDEFLTAAIEQINQGEADAFKDNLRMGAMGENCQNADEVERIIRQMQADMSAEQLMGQAQAMKTQMDITAILPNISASTLIIHNEHDGFFDLSEEEYLRDHIKNAELAVVSDVGHMSLLERPDHLSQLISDFLAQ